MKGRFLVIILSIILMLSVIGNIVIFALTDDVKKDTVQNSIEVIDKEAENVAVGDSFVRTDIALKKSVTIGKDSDVAIYEYSVKYGKNRVYDFYSAQDHQYIFSRDGELIGCYDLTASSEKGNTKLTVTKKQACDIAQQFIDDELDGRADRFVLTDCYFNESSQVYYIVFSKVYNDFVRAQSVSINVSSSGNVMSWAFSRYGEFDDFDPDILGDVSEKDIEDYIHDYAATIDRGAECVIKGILLEKSNGMYVLKINFEITGSDQDGNETTELRSTYYEI